MKQTKIRFAMCPDCTNLLTWDENEQRYIHLTNECAFSADAEGNRVWDNAKREESIKQRIKASNANEEELLSLFDDEEDKKYMRDIIEFEKSKSTRFLAKGKKIVVSDVQNIFDMEANKSI